MYFVPRAGLHRIFAAGLGYFYHPAPEFPRRHLARIIEKYPGASKAATLRFR